MELNQEALKIIFTDARTHSHWKNLAVGDDVLQAAYNLAKMGPTSANCSPMRIYFVKSKEAKEKLKTCLQEGNIEKTMKAPATAIIAMDMEFYEQLPKLFPQAPARSWFAGNPPAIEETAFRNGSLEGAYFIIAARAVGLDCGPMSGFDRKKCDELFFSGTKIKSNFLVNLGHGDNTNLYPRNPRLSFDEACRII